ncbi:MAG: hypothetical protein NZ520_01615 [bacterium]|nr:hypothetical protein [bacterium]
MARQEPRPPVVILSGAKNLGLTPGRPASCAPSMTGKVARQEPRPPEQLEGEPPGEPKKPTLPTRPLAPFVVAHFSASPPRRNG